MHYHDLIRSTRREIRRACAFRGLSALVLTVLVLLGVLGVIGLAELSREIVSLVVLAVFVLVAALTVWFLLVPLILPPSKRKLLLMLEEAHPEFRGNLILADYLENRAPEVEKLGYSTQLQEQILDFARNLPNDSGRCACSPSRSLGDFRKVFLLLLLADTVLLSFRPMAFVAGWQQVQAVLRPLSVTLPRVALHVEAPQRVKRNSPVTIQAQTMGSSSLKPYVHLLGLDGQWSQVAMTASSRPFPGGRGLDGGNRFFCEIARLVRSTTFCVSAGSTVSSLYAIEVLDPPRVEAFQFDFHYPSYMGLQERSERKLDGNILVPQGTVVQMSVHANNPLESADVIYVGGRRLTLDIVGESIASATFTVQDSTRYQVFLKDTFGLALTDGPFYQVLVKPDASPSVSFIAPAVQVMDIPEEMKIAVSGQAEDDYGLSKAEFIYQVGYDQPEQVMPLPLKPLGTSAHVTSVSPTAAEIAFEWDLRTLDLLPGETASYWLRVFDNDPTNGPKEGVSGVQILRFPSLYEIYEEVEKQELAQVDTMDDLLQKQREIQKETESLRETIQRDSEKPEDQVPWEQKETLKDLKTRQEEIQKEMQLLQQQYEQSVSQIKEDAALSAQTFEKMAKIQQLLDQMMTNEMKETLSQFNQALEQLTAQQMDRSLGDLNSSMEKFEESLDRTLSLLQQNYMERSLERLAYQAEQLANTQQEIQERTEQRSAEDSLDDLARRQERLEKSADEFVKDVSALAQMAEQSGNKEMQEKLEQVLEQAEQQNLQESLQQAKENLSEGKKEEALQQQQKAQETLNQMSAMMNECKECMSGGMSITFDVQLWHRLLDRAFHVSELQEQFEKSLPSAVETNLYTKVSLPMNRYAVLQTVYADECSRIAADVRELASKNPFIDMDVVQLLESGADALRRGSQQAKDSYGYALLQQSRQSLGLVNMAIRKMLEVLDTMMSMSSGSSLESYFQMLQQIIQQQGQINEMTKRLDGQSRDRPDWMQQLQALGQQQQMVRQAMEELRKKYENMQNLLGELSGLGKEMQEIEELLQQDETGAKVQEKQERLLQRLLDAEKSVREQKDDQKRKGETAQEYERLDRPADLDDAKALLRKKALENKARLNRERIVPEYRDVLKDYFQRLSEEAF